MAARTEEEGSAYSSRGRGRAAPWQSRDGGDEWVVERRGEERRVQRRGIFRAFEGLFRFVGSSETLDLAASRLQRVRRSRASGVRPQVP